ncbi:hypothetical protein Tco_0181522 [Tanacetum coccineum]
MTIPLYLLFLILIILSAIIRMRREVAVPLLMLITLFLRMIRFFLRLSPNQGGITSVLISNNNDLLESPEFESFHVDIYDIPSFPRPPPEPPDVCLDMLYNDESFEPGEGENIVVEEDDSFTFIIRTFLPFLTYPKVSPLYCSTRSVDLIFDPGIITFHFLKPLAFLWKFLSSIFALPKDN